MWNYYLSSKIGAFSLSELIDQVDRQSSTASKLFVTILTDALGSRGPRGYSKLNNMQYDLLKVYAPQLVKTGIPLFGLEEDIEILSNLRYTTLDGKEEHNVFLSLGLIDEIRKRREDLPLKNQSLIAVLSREFTNLLPDLGESSLKDTRPTTNHTPPEIRITRLTNQKLNERVRRGIGKWANLSPDERVCFLREKKVVFFDLNTTGLDPDSHEIIQFSAVDLNGNVLMDQKFCPRVVKEWREDAKETNGLTYEDLEHEPYLSDCYHQIQDLIDQADALGGFYIDRFDLPFLNYADIILPDELYIIEERGQARSLKAYSKRMGFENPDPQSSLERARAVAFGVKKRLFQESD